MRGIKIPQHEFALKMQGGGLCARGGVFAGHYGMTFAMYLSMPGYTCEYMCIPFSYCYNWQWINWFSP